MATPRSSVAATKQTRSEEQSKTGLELEERNGKGTARATTADYSPRRRERDALTPAQALYRPSLFTRRNHRVRVRAERHSVTLPERSRSGALRLRAGVAGHKRRAGRRLGPVPQAASWRMGLRHISERSRLPAGHCGRRTLARGFAVTIKDVCS